MIYSFKAKDDYAPTFVSENIKRLLGYCPEKYLEQADFWRSYVHPEDLASVEASQPERLTGTRSQPPGSTGLPTF